MRTNSKLSEYFSRQVLRLIGVTIVIGAFFTWLLRKMNSSLKEAFLFNGLYKYAKNSTSSLILTNEVGLKVRPRYT
jgi:hypothetical protein